MVLRNKQAEPSSPRAYETYRRKQELDAQIDSLRGDYCKVMDLSYAAAEKT